MKNLAAKAEKSQINEGKTIDLPCGLDYEKMDQLADYKMIQDDLNSKSSNIMRDINEACKVENLEKAANLITSVNKLRGQETDLNDENLKGLNISYDLTIRTIVESAIERTAKSVPNWKQGNADYLLL